MKYRLTCDSCDLEELREDIGSALSRCAEHEDRWERQHFVDVRLVDVTDGEPPLASAD